MPGRTDDTAFEVLAAELALHGAPADLIAGARSAAGDEVRHTTTTRELALRFGVSATTPDVRVSRALARGR